ncbi:MAG: peptidoglycan-associated lipoprotein Pal [Desulfobacterales bacterium]
MRRKFVISAALILVIPGLLFLCSCARKTSTLSPVGMGDAAGETSVTQTEEEDMITGPTEEELAAEEAERIAATEREQFVNQDIYFNFDKADLSPEAQAVLKEKAAWLRENPEVDVIIEGHCDERGTNEYNIALGERRAQSAKIFLVDLGISPDRLSTISYGEEMPVDPGHNESAWQKNRRAHFQIK